MQRPARLSLATLLTLTALAASLVLPASAFAEKTLGVSSGTFKFQLDAGQIAEGEVFLTNEGDEQITVLVYAADQNVAEDGAVEFSVPSRGDISSLQQPSAWVRLGMPKEAQSFANVPYVILDPGDRVPIDFKVQVPTGVAPGDHNVMVFFEMAELPEEGDGTQMRVSGRIGSRITLRVNGELVERLDVRPFTVPSIVFDRNVPFSFTVNNSGNVDQRVTASAFLLDRNEASVAETRAIEAQTVFAATSLDASGTLSSPEFAFGPHEVRLEVIPVDDQGNILDAGKDAIISTRTVWILPIWAIVAAAVIVVFLIGIIVFFARRGAKKKAAAAAAPAPMPDYSDEVE